MIRPATENDLPVCRDIERACGAAFRDLGMDAIAEDEPASIEELRRYAAGGRAWVTDVDGRVVAYLIVDRVDGNAHIEQVSVHPDHARRGLGRAMLDHLAALSSEQGDPALTLTTFVEVPWNGPYYLRCGFRYLGEDELTAELREVRRHEAARGLDRWPRAAMRRELPEAGERPERDALSRTGAAGGSRAGRDSPAGATAAG